MQRFHFLPAKILDGPEDTYIAVDIIKQWIHKYVFFFVFAYLMDLVNLVWYNLRSWKSWNRSVAVMRYKLRSILSGLAFNFVRYNSLRIHALTFFL